MTTSAYGPAPSALTEDMIRAAVNRIRDAPYTPHQHLVGPADVHAGQTAYLAGQPHWVTCADCGQPINLGHRDTDTTTPTAPTPPPDDVTCPSDGVLGVPVSVPGGV